MGILEDEQQFDETDFNFYIKAYKCLAKRYISSLNNFSSDHIGISYPFSDLDEKIYIPFIRI